MDEQQKPININAFPTPDNTIGIFDNGNLVGHQDGMTLRDYFAAKAMQAFIQTTNDGSNTEYHPSYDECIANDSYEIADAMLKERLR